jgi:predicted metalloendopeptidase
MTRRESQAQSRTISGKSYSRRRCRIGLWRVLEQMYAQETITVGMRQLVTKVDNDVRQAFEQLIDSADWLSKKARRNAIARQREVRLEVGYEAPLPTFAQNHLEDSPYLSLALTFLGESVTRALRRVGRPYDLRQDMKPAAVDLSYVYKDRASFVHVPAGFLAGLFESGATEIHPAALYGQLAPALGHERQHHAFDWEGWENEAGVKPGDTRRMDVRKLAAIFLPNILRCLCHAVRLRRRITGLWIQPWSCLLRANVPPRSIASFITSFDIRPEDGM